VVCGIARCGGIRGKCYSRWWWNLFDDIYYHKIIGCGVTFFSWVEFLNHNINGRFNFFGFPGNRALENFQMSMTIRTLSLRRLCVYHFGTFMPCWDL
jgi:hypothetical protein